MFLHEKKIWLYTDQKNPAKYGVCVWLIHGAAYSGILGVHIDEILSWNKHTCIPCVAKSQKI